MEIGYRIDHGVVEVLNEVVGFSTDTSKQLPNLKDLLPNIAVQSFDTPPPDLNGDPKKPKGTNLWRKLLQELSSLPRSIAVLGMIAFLSSLGTIIEQDRVSFIFTPFIFTFCSFFDKNEFPFFHCVCL